MVPSFDQMEQGPWVAPVQEVVQEVAPRRDLVARLAEVGRHLVEIRGAQVAQPAAALDQAQAVHQEQAVVQLAALQVDHAVSQAEMFDLQGQRAVNLALRLHIHGLLRIQSLKKRAKISNLRINSANCF